MLLNLAILIYTGRNSPLIGKLCNRLELFNEFSVCFITIQMSFFIHHTLGYDIKTVPEELLSATVALLPNESDQNTYGYMMNSCMFYYIYANILVILYYLIRQISLLIKKCYRVNKFQYLGIGKIKETNPEKHKDKLDKLMKDY